MVVWLSELRINQLYRSSQDSEDLDSHAKKRKREQGKPYKAWDAGTSRMKWIQPISPKLVNVTIKEPKPPPTKKVPSLRQIAGRALYKNALKIVETEYDVLVSDDVFENLPFTDQVKQSLKSIPSKLKALTYDMKSEMNYRVYYNNLTLVSMLKNTLVLTDDMNLELRSYLESKGVFVFERMDETIIFASGYHTHSLFYEFPNLFQILVLFLLQNIIESNIYVRTAFTNDIGINAQDELPFWLRTMRRLTVDATG